MRATVTTADSVLAVGDAKQVGDSTSVGSTFLLRNRTATAPVFLEIDAAATSAQGFEWQTTDGPMEITLEKGEELHAILAAGAADQVIHKLKKT